MPSIDKASSSSLESSFVFGEASTTSSAPSNNRHSADEPLLLYHKYQAQEPIQVRNGCMLIPIVFVVWYYWTRRAAKRVFRLLLTGGSDACFPHQQEGVSSPSEEDQQQSVDEDDASEMDVENRVPVQTMHDKFDTWDDVMAQESSSAHMVRWITCGAGSRQRQAKRRMRAVSKAIMNRTSSSSLAHQPIIQFPTQPQYPTTDENHEPPNCEGLLAVDDALSSSGCNNWECIDDTVIEVSMPTKSLADDVSQHSGVLT